MIGLFAHPSAAFQFGKCSRLLQTNVALVSDSGAAKLLLQPKATYFENTLCGPVCLANIFEGLQPPISLMSGRRRRAFEVLQSLLDIESQLLNAELPKIYFEKEGRTLGRLSLVANKYARQEKFAADIRLFGSANLNNFSMNPEILLHSNRPEIRMIALLQNGSYSGEMPRFSGNLKNLSEIKRIEEEIFSQEFPLNDANAIGHYVIVESVRELSDGTYLLGINDPAQQQRYSKRFRPSRVERYNMDVFRDVGRIGPGIHDLKIFKPNSSSRTWHMARTNVPVITSLMTIQVWQ